MDESKIFQLSFTGIVLVLFFLLGLSLSNYYALYKLFNFIKTNYRFVFAILSFPFLGLLIQLVNFAVQYLIFVHPYRDEARILLAKVLREHLLKAAHILSEDAKKAIEMIPDDSLFVLLYYTRAPSHLIEWARRRRTIQYLGINYAITVVIGVTVGIISGVLLKLSVFNNIETRIGTCLIIGIFFIGLSIFIGLKAKRDADLMELAWCYLELMPDVKEQLSSYRLNHILLLDEYCHSKEN